MKLFEERVKGALYFKVKRLPYGCVDHSTIYARQREVLKIILASDGRIKEYFVLQVLCMMKKIDYDKCVVVHDYNLHGSNDSEDEVTVHFEVDCWESAWTKLTKLPWVTGTGKVL